MSQPSQSKVWILLLAVHGSSKLFYSRGLETPIFVREKRAGNDLSDIRSPKQKNTAATKIIAFSISIPLRFVLQWAAPRHHHQWPWPTCPSAGIQAADDDDTCTDIAEMDRKASKHTHTNQVKSSQDKMESNSNKTKLSQQKDSNNKKGELYSSCYIQLISIDTKCLIKM